MAAVKAIMLLLCAGAMALGQAIGPPPPDARETQWSAYLATTIGGFAEHRLPDGRRVDILTAEVAWEVEWADHWAQSFGQAIGYAIAADRKPGVWLLKRGREDDREYKDWLSVVVYLRGYGVPLEYRATEVR